MVHSKTGTFNSVSFLWANAELRNNSIARTTPRAMTVSEL